jgi:predicted protein tyrosine phosphatase
MYDCEEWKQLFDLSKRKTIVMTEAGQQVVDCENFFGRPVLGKVVVLPLSGAREFKYTKPWACISICDEGDPPAKISDVNREDILRLYFDDYEFPGPGRKLMEDNQAAEIWEFVRKVWDKVDLLMVHCYAGISRSSAVAMAISDKYQPDQSNFFKQLYSPNSLVYAKMKGL